jgi:hypothetical protein
MGFSYNNNVLNQKGSPAIYTDTFANRPTFGYQGRLFISTDTAAIYEDTGTSWTLIANVSSGAGTLQQVTTNGNTTNVGITVTAGGVSTNSLTDTALTLGSVLFAGAAGLVTQDNPAFFWDDTNNRLGLNTVTPSNTLDVHFAGSAASVGINNTAGNQSAIVFANTGTNKWRIGNSATNTFDFYNNALTSIAAYLDGTNNAATFNGSVQVLSSGGQRDTTSNLNSSVSDSSPAVSVKVAGRFTNVGSAYVTKLILSDTVNADCAITFQPNATIANSLFGIGINSLNNFVLKGNGNVGIGESNPASILNVKGPSPRFTIDTDATLNQIGSIYFRDLNVGATSRGSISTAGQPLSFGAAGANVEQMRLSNGGNLLINSTIDDTVNKLQVTGGTRITGELTMNGFYTKSKTQVGTANGTDTIFSINYGFPGSINGSIKVYANAGIVGGGNLSSCVLTFNFTGANNAAASLQSSNISNSAISTIASANAGFTSITVLTASLTGVTTNGFNISLSNTITGTQITAPTYYIQVTYATHGNSSLS